VELNTGADLDATKCSEVTGAELGGSTDLGSGRGRRMERDRYGRRDSGWQAGGTGGVVPASGAGRVRPVSGAVQASGVRPAMAGGMSRGRVSERRKRSPSERGERAESSHERGA
jgi:hypothetical protein